jgi:CPA2 family monovalent cation:H+ antiporter-2
MMVDVALIATYIIPILCIIVAIMLGHIVLSTGGFILAGKPLKTAMQCSFSLTQIGEFAFILATLGMSLHVTSDFLYPIVVAVSVFTTFTTPYMIRLAEPAYHALTRVLPAGLIAKLERNTDESDDKAPDELQQLWNDNFKRFIFNMLINTVLCIAIMAIMLYYGQPIIAGIVPDKWVHAVTALVALILCSPFLWMLMKAGADSPDVDKLWQSGSRWRVRITALGMLRLIITAIFVSYFVDYAIPWSKLLGVFAIVAIMLIIYYSSHLEKQSKGLTKNFTDNLSARERNNKSQQPKE